MKKLFWIPLAATAALVSGCGSNPPTATNDSPATNGSTASHSLPAQPRTGTTSQLPTEPKEVVRLFLDSMRQGNGTQLAALLSTAAREEITRKKLEIDPLGSPLATFQIGEAGTHPEQPDSMLVSTVWSEPAQNGQPEANLDVVWALRKEATGWRICEMAVDPMNGEDVQIVNFEHLEPEQPAPQEQRVASLPNAPASFPAAANGQQFQQPPQQQPPMQQFQPPNQPQFPQQSGAFPPPGNPSAGYPPSNLPAGNAPTNGFQPNALPAIVPSSGQLPPAQPGSSFTLPPANGTLPPANSGNFPTNPTPYAPPR
jgi:hypothetical protein